MAHTETTKAINKYATRITMNIKSESSHDECSTDKATVTAKHITSITPDKYTTDECACKQRDRRATMHGSCNDH